jgi:hypothetical protein
MKRERQIYNAFMRAIKEGCVRPLTPLPDSHSSYARLGCDRLTHPARLSEEEPLFGRLLSGWRGKC